MAKKSGRHAGAAALSCCFGGACFIDEQKTILILKINANTCLN
jgi:hypothetical protein